MDISDKQTIELRMQIVDKYIRGNESYDGDLSNVIKMLKDNIKINVWDNMNVSDKNRKIEECIKYLEVEDEIQNQYGEKWNNLTNTDKKNIIKEKIDRDSNSSNDSDGIKEISISNNSDDDSSLLEI